MKLSDYRIIPVVVVDDAALAEGLGKALVDGGIPIAEVTLRTAAAADAIRAMAQNPELLVGAGTVLNPAQVDEAAAAGAQFIVSPGLSRAVVERSAEHGLPVIPGAVTPTEIMAALDLGITTCKFFPAGLYGGITALKALGAPFPQVSFVPTGGVSESNLADFLSLPNVAAVGGSWMVPPGAIAASEFDQIRGLCAAAATIAADADRGRRP